MSKLKEFFDRRSEGLLEEKLAKEGTGSKEVVKRKEPVEENPNLTDEEFWAIANQFIKESRNSGRNQVEILQAILAQYTPLKIEQFAKRYEELNK
ncbi:MAG TPA: hypothetical protein ENK46_11910 [Flavobacteriia bacterium]|jgi:hypothetical protein|nr:hypothetical protein [Flavobacteriia bacterium]